MPTSARVVVLPQSDRTLQVCELELPDPGPHQVVVRQSASGVCHSQLHQIHSPRNSPVLLGHESTGVVVAAGSEVDHVAEGDTVLVTWVPRDAARNQRIPEPAKLTLPGGEVAVAQNSFTWADHTIADEQYVVKVRGDIPKDVTAILGCAVITGSGAVINTANVQKGESVAVFGVGGVGLCAVAAAKRVGAHPIIAVDLEDEKLAFAERFGATHTVNASREDPVEAIRNLTTDRRAINILRQPVSGADYTFDCIGVKTTMEQIVPAARECWFGGVRTGGKAVLVGVPQTNVELNALDVLLHEKQFLGSIGGSCCPDRDLPLFVEWHSNGDLPLEELVTERFSIDQINEAVSSLEAGKILGRAILVFDP